MDVWGPSYDVFPSPSGQGVWGRRPPGKQGGLGGRQVPNDKRDWNFFLFPRTLIELNRQPHFEKTFPSILLN